MVQAGCAQLNRNLFLLFVCRYIASYVEPMDSEQRRGGGGDDPSRLLAELTNRGGPDALVMTDDMPWPRTQSYDCSSCADCKIWQCSATDCRQITVHTEAPSARIMPKSNICCSHCILAGCGIKRVRKNAVIANFSYSNSQQQRGYSEQCSFSRITLPAITASWKCEGPLKPPSPPR